MRYRTASHLVWVLLLTSSPGCTTQRTDVPAPPPSAPLDPQSLTVFQCGDRQVTAAPTEGGLRLVIGGSGEAERTFDLRPVEAASGARYEAVGDPSTVFWSKGGEATVTVEGETYPTCTTAEPSLDGFRATGNEPGWRIDAAGSTMTLRTLGDERTSPIPDPVQVGDSTRYTSSDGTWALTVVEEPCTDTMSGMRYPNTVVASIDGRTLRGCGGTTGQLLRGTTWVAEDIDGDGLIDRSRVTAVFSPDGRVSGDASCNRYNGPYALSGEVLTIGPLAATKRACAPALMEQEGRVLAILQDGKRLTWTEDGALRLHTEDGRTLTMRRE